MEPLALPLDDDDAVEKADTVSIELNFKAFADNVPTSQHAKRKQSRDDPSIQDFADQVLELAALRAELKRLSRDYEILQQQALVRDARLEALHNELMATRMQMRVTAPQEPARSVQPQRQPQRQPPRQPQPQPQEDPRAARRQAQEEARALRRQLLEDVRGDEVTVSLENTPAVPHLIPIDQLDPPMPLTGEIVTIGRTRSSDICIPSRGVSRDHARLLVAPGRVTLVDVSTTNGCFVNGVLVSRHRLRDGDLVRIGDRSFRFALSVSTLEASAASPSVRPAAENAEATTDISLRDHDGDRRG